VQSECGSREKVDPDKHVRCVKNASKKEIFETRTECIQEYEQILKSLQICVNFVEK
jgi:hypothetical protein